MESTAVVEETSAVTRHHTGAQEVSVAQAILSNWSGTFRTARSLIDKLVGHATSDETFYGALANLLTENDTRAAYSVLLAGLDNHLDLTAESFPYQVDRIALAGMTGQRFDRVLTVSAFLHDGDSHESTTVITHFSLTGTEFSLVRVETDDVTTMHGCLADPGVVVPVRLTDAVDVVRDIADIVYTSNFWMCVRALAARDAGLV